MRPTRLENDAQASYSRSLIAVAAICLGMGCGDRDGGSTPGEDPDLSAGRYLLAVDATRLPDVLYLEAMVIVNDGSADFVFQPLRSDQDAQGQARPDARTPVGEPVSVAGVDVRGGTFAISLGEIALHEETTPSENVVVATFNFQVSVYDADRLCGTVDGDIREPTVGSLEGSTFGAIRTLEAFSNVATPLVKCPDCTRTCAGRACGDDGCGGRCGSCPEGHQCTHDGACEAAPSGPEVSCSYPVTTGRAHLGEALVDPRPSATLDLAFGTGGGLLSVGDRACSLLSLPDSPPDWYTCQQGYDCQGCELSVYSISGAWYLSPHVFLDWPSGCEDIAGAYRIYPATLEPLSCYSIPKGCYRVGDEIVEFAEEFAGVRADVRNLEGYTYHSCLIDTRLNPEVDSCFYNYTCSEQCTVGLFGTRHRPVDHLADDTGVTWRISTTGLGICPFSLTSDSPEPITCPPRPGSLSPACIECLQTCREVLGSHHSCCGGSGCMCEDDCN